MAGCLGVRKARIAALLVPWLLSALPGCSSEDPQEGEPGVPDAAAGVCPSPSPGVFEGLSVTGPAGMLTGTLISASPLPPVKGRNDWTVEIGDADGTPLADVELVPMETDKPAVHGWMVEHRHVGIPEATFGPTGEPGRFDATIHLQMRGAWEIRFDAASPSAGTERLTFHVCLPD